MQFDKEYFKKLSEFFNSNNDVVYSVADLADDTQKFIAYTRLYMHSRNLSEAEVLISFNEKQIRITEFFQNVLNAQVIESLDAQMYIDKFNVVQTPLGKSIEPILSKPAFRTAEEQNKINSIKSVHSPHTTQVKKSPFDK